MEENIERRKILITNDDGIDAPGIKLLTKIARQFGEVVVVAPKTEQSAMGQGITVHSPITIHKLESGNEGVDAYAIAGKPADCVKVAMDHLNFKPDFVWSGINNGPNLGTDVLYSGTVGAALEAIVYGIPAAAFSCPRGDFSGAETELEAVIDYLFDNNLWTKAAAINVNFPIHGETPSKGIRLTRQGHRIIVAEYRFDVDKYWQMGRLVEQVNEPDTDVRAAEEGYISITPLGIDRTKYDLLEKWRNK